MSSPASILPFLLHSLLLFTSTALAVAETPTVYEALQDYDFPVGLLPTGVTSYTLNKDTGEFEVKLSDTCEFSVSGYDLKYKSTISGVISKDKLTKLKGVSVKVIIIWVDIVEVTRDSEDLDFSVGILSAGFDVDQFEESPECGCGFDCDSLESG
ncbi:unnamed protein product [Lactuca saligna]|uniref:DUF538 domain-containing protein n=1 Tax=Lactuca saligna TaxID=75948 RepID=A0AA35ZWR3_LACSI|nr:unnamed protein product [Lactuca saligna]